MNIQSALTFERKHIRNVEPKLRFRKGTDFAAWQKEAYDKLYGLLGLSELAQCEDHFTVCWEEEHDDFVEQRFTFYSEQDYAVPCHILLPKQAKKPYKTVICLQGHSTGMHISLGRPKYDRDAATISGGDRDFALRAVREGYAAIAMEQRYMGECGGDERGPGCVRGNAMTALLTGRTAIGERVWDVMRLIDVMEKYFGCLDRENIVCLGSSGGGTTTFYTACIDRRIKCAVPSCSVCTYRDSIGGVHHCGCNFIPHIANYFDMGDLAGLIAPRKLVIVNGKEDDIFPLAGVLETFDLTKELYAAAGVQDSAALVTGEEGHRFYADLAWPVIHKMMED